MTEFTVRQVEVDPFADDSVDLEPDESVLTAEYRAANRLVLAVLTPSESSDTDNCGVCGCGSPCDHGCCSA